jgi:hypothetical protein
MAKKFKSMGTFRARCSKVVDVLAVAVDEKGHKIMDRRRLGLGQRGSACKEQHKEDALKQQMEREAKEQKEKAYRAAKERELKERQEAQRIEESQSRSYSQQSSSYSSPSYGAYSHSAPSYGDCSYSSSSCWDGPRCLDGPLDMRFSCNQGMEKYND